MATDKRISELGNRTGRNITGAEEMPFEDIEGNGKVSIESLREYMNRGVSTTDDIVQSTGPNEDRVMSQKAVTREITSIRGEINDIEDQCIENNTLISQRVGNVESSMSNKLSKTDIVQNEGRSMVKVMSQASVTTYVERLNNAMAARLYAVEQNRRVALTQEEYDALDEYDENTLYLIYE